jgi:predicted nucleotidyltransferase
MIESATPEAVIADALAAAVGACPVILCGSHATGEASDGSDYDIVAVLPAHRIPQALPRLDHAAKSLEAELGTPVSINPVPRFRLRHGGRTLFMWKLVREGRILAAPAGFSLGPQSPPVLSHEAAHSYAASAVRYLIADLEPPELARARLPTHTQRAVRKALLHVLQLRLLRDGRYASRLEDALSTPQCHSELEELVRQIERPDCWFRTRDLLLDHLAGELPERRSRKLVANAQYLALTALRGGGTPIRALTAGSSISARLAMVAARLAGSLQFGGEIDPSGVEAASRSLPRFLRPAGEPEWHALREVVEEQWPSASPLVGF